MTNLCATNRVNSFVRWWLKSRLRRCLNRVLRTLIYSEFLCALGLIWRVLLKWRVFWLVVRLLRRQNSLFSVSTSGVLWRIPVTRIMFTLRQERRTKRSIWHVRRHCVVMYCLLSIFLVSSRSKKDHQCRTRLSAFHPLNKAVFVVLTTSKSVNGTKMIFVSLKDLVIGILMEVS